MLAPLKDRSILARSGSADAPASDTESVLRQALRQARLALRRAATQGARQTIALTNEVSHLKEMNRQLRSRLDDLENGQTIVSLGQQLMALRHENDALIAAAHRVWYLDRTLSAAHLECERLARERDSALDQLHDSAQPTRHI